MKVRNINEAYGMRVEFDSVEEMKQGFAACGYNLPEDGLIEGRDYEVVKNRAAQKLRAIKSESRAVASRANGRRGGRPSAEYAIVVTRSYYGPRMEKSRLTHDVLGEWRGTRAEAIAKIGELDHALYYLEHNEASRPIYTMVKA
jgi:hypothetical protein